MQQTSNIQHNQCKEKLFCTKNLAIMAVLSAIAYVLYLIPKMIPIFNLPFFPPWLELQISDLPALLGGFAIGPWASVIIIVIKCCLKMPLSGTNCVGELADIVVGIAFVLPASIMYHKNKTRKNAILGMVVGTVCAVIMSVLANRFALVPLYANVMFGGLDKVVSAVKHLYPNVTEQNFYFYYLMLGVVPFNLLRCILSAVITYFIYKPLSKVLHWETHRVKQ